MRLFFSFIVACVLVGCGTLKQSTEPAHYSGLRKDHRDPLHVYSCGPIALQNAFQNLGIEISEETLSHIIQKDFKCNTLIRNFLAVFVNEARAITFPEEMLSVLKKNNFKVKSIKSLEDLDETIDTAIVLIKKKGTLTYHWACFPYDKNISTFFGIDTSIKEIYLISE